MKPLRVESVDVPIVVGSGIAGLSTALRVGSCVVITKGVMASGSSEFAQGGIAAAIGDDDSVASHAADTISVGGGLVDEAVAHMAAGRGPGLIEWLESVGTRFDHNTAGAIDLGREAGHSANRILHADGDATGREVMRALTAAVALHPGIDVYEHTEVVDLARAGERIAGVVIRTTGADDRVLLAPAVVLATGGIGGAYAKTTNPPGVRGDGLALAARSGAVLADLEFVQFHPTALDQGSDPLPLLTEALRGAGATLVDADGRRFMREVHPDAELAPRDVVAREVWRQARSGGAYLDATVIGDTLPQRFPTVYATARAAGLDALTTPLPVTPAAHYHMGGVATDADGRSSLPGLYACGEVASTGLHGANRLASNSLLEGMVFAERVAAAIEHDARPLPADVIQAPADLPLPSLGATAEVAAVREAMWEHAGVVRSGTGLSRLLSTLDELAPGLDGSVAGRNLLAVARLVTTAALARRESRGSHFRSDYPKRGSLPRSRVRPVSVGTVSLDVTARIRRYVA